MVSKTREKLLEVARQLFVRKGLAHTTMNDIAAASDKGRRTIYTYFKSKRDIYNAVVERESDRHVQKMRLIAENKTLTPDRQLFEFLLTRYHPTNDPASKSLLSKLTIDIKRTERFRQLTYSKEQQLLETILRRGVQQDIFDPEQTRRLQSFMGRWLMEIDRASFTEPTAAVPDTENLNLIEFIVKGTLKNK